MRITAFAGFTVLQACIASSASDPTAKLRIKWWIARLQAVANVADRPIAVIQLGSHVARKPAVVPSTRR